MPQNFLDQINKIQHAVKKLPQNPPRSLIDELKKTKKLFITGSPSQIFFTAPNIKYWSMRSGLNLDISFELPAQAAKYYLLEHTVIMLTASQSHPDIDRLAKRLCDINHPSLFAAVPEPHSKLNTLVKKTYSLNLTHPVTQPTALVTQALFLKNTLALMQNRNITAKLKQLSSQLSKPLKPPVNPQIIRKIKNAKNIFFVAENNGLAAELAFRAINILGKPAYSLEPSILQNYLEHAVKTADCLIFPNPSEKHLAPLLNLSQQKAPTAIAISEEPTPLKHTITVPDIGELQDYIYLTAAWKILAKAEIKN